MEKIINGVTTNKSNSNIESVNETVSKKMKAMEEKMDYATNWFNEEKNKRVDIAVNSATHNNDICPICGKKMGERERCNGLPLVDACVCPDCDKRYVFPFRMWTSGCSTEETKQKAYRHFGFCFQAELQIGMSDILNSLFANHTDVAK